MRGSRLAESAPNNLGADPLNLMRIMPPKEARSAMRSSAHGFLVVNNRIDQESRKPGKEFLVGFTSWLPGFQIFSYGLK
jgi:hypothetical protein